MFGSLSVVIYILQAYAHGRQVGNRVFAMSEYCFDSLGLSLGKLSAQITCMNCVLFEGCSY